MKASAADSVDFVGQFTPNLRPNTVDFFTHFWVKINYLALDSPGLVTTNLPTMGSVNDRVPFI